MSREEAEKILESTDTDYKTYKFPIRDGMNLLSKYYTEDSEYAWFEHDVMGYADFSGTVAKMSKEEVELMGKMGWYESDDCWCHF